MYQVVSTISTIVVFSIIWYVRRRGAFIYKKLWKAKLIDDKWERNARIANLKTLIRKTEDISIEEDARKALRYFTISYVVSLVWMGIAFAFLMWGR